MRSMVHSPAMIVRGWRRTGLACLLLSIVGTTAAAAIDTVAARQTATGRWMLVLDDTNRRCRLTLRNERVASMFAMGMPAGCRRALPILSPVSRWTLAEGGLFFDDDDGKPVLQFSSQKDASTLVAKGPEGESYFLVAQDGAHVDGLPGIDDRKIIPVAAKGAEPGAAKGAEPAAATGPDPATLPGRYLILRRGGKDTGCELTLDAKAKGPKGSKKATLAPSCKDQGIVIFNPVGWRFENGRLTLIAKKGHATHLDLKSDGTWLKDPAEGSPLSLKKT